MVDRRLLLIPTAFALLATAALAKENTPTFTGTPLKVIRTENWERTELHEDKNPLFVKEPYAEASRRTIPDIQAGFDGDSEPPSSRFLLHCAPQYDRADDKTPPVLLVHGAVVDATRSWGANGFKGRAGHGMAARLTSSGHRVFAITFSHPHGDCWLQSEQVANAIARVKQLTGAPKVDLVAHSKGGVAARLYCSNMRKPGMTAYRNDVRRLVLLASPNDGIDVGFAYPNLNYWIIMNGANAALTFTEALVYGVWKDLKKQSMFAEGGCFPGQCQLVKRWDGVYGLYDDPSQFDVETTYKGGLGKVSRSPGIDKCIAEGGDLIAKMNKQGVDKRIELALLAGQKPNLMGFVGERRGPSDGLLLVRSALATEGLTKQGARVVKKDVLFLSHIEIVYAEPALRWLEETLAP